MSSKLIIEERRKDVLALLLARIPIRQIAKKLDWDYATIWSDVNAIRTEYRNRELKDGDNDPVTDYLLRNEDQYRKAYSIFTKSQDDDVKLRALARMQSLDKEQLEKLQTLGLLQKNMAKLPVREIKVSWDMGLVKDLQGDKDADVD